jgi:hypothetical protein
MRSENINPAYYRQLQCINLKAGSIFYGGLHDLTLCKVILAGILKLPIFKQTLF